MSKTKALHETAQSILFELSERSETKSIQQHDYLAERVKTLLKDKYTLKKELGAIWNQEAQAKLSELDGRVCQIVDQLGHSGYNTAELKSLISEANLNRIELERA